MYAKDLYEPKYQFLINKRESIGLKYFNDPKAFIDYSNDIHVYKKINDYNPETWVIPDFHVPKGSRNTRECRLEQGNI